MNYLRRLVSVATIIVWLVHIMNAHPSDTTNVAVPIPISPELVVHSPVLAYNNKNTSTVAPTTVPNLIGKKMLKPDGCDTGFDLFNFNGNTQNFVVPAGVTSITIIAKGGDGGSATGGSVAFPGGGGGSVTATFSVNPGDNIRVIVGGSGGSGEDGGGGGGGTAVINSTTGTLLLVAGGGGGGSFNTSGGNASATAGGGNGGSAGANAGGGGGGILGNGQNSTNGGGGGGQAVTTAIASGGAGVSFAGDGGAGFGGGGGASSGIGGGGGGYTGGNTGNGGTNFVAGSATNVSNNGGSSNFSGASDGQVRINYVCPGICVPNNPAPFSPGVQDYVVPADATSVTITARGGDGGWWTGDRIRFRPGGAGGLVTATFNLTPGDNLRVIVGNAGSGGEDNGGGGGGTAIINCGNPANCATGTILLVAGGGGGGSFNADGGNAGTTAGNGNGGSGADPFSGGAGGGINGAGQDGGGFGGGQASKTGGSGGGAPDPNLFAGPGGDGFGGGGGGGGTGGGGGGYSGGNPGAGGTNFIGPGATNVSNGLGSRSIDGPVGGQVTITYLCQLLCPTLTAAAPAVNVVNSSCGANCTTTNGSISAPGSSCPSGSTLQYSTDNGTNWSTTIPTYNQTTPITVLTRCNCIVNSTISSPTTSVTTAPAGCRTPTATLPNEVKACEGGTASFSVNASGTGMLSYQWQVSTNGGGSFSNISGANAATFQLNNVTPALNNNQYRVIVTDPNGCTTTSNATLLTITNVLPTITGNPQNTTVCGGGTATFTVGVPGSSSTRTFQWQEDSGNGFVNIFNGVNYTQVNGQTLFIFNTPESFNGRKYRVIVTDGCSTTSQAAMLMVTPRPNLIALNKTVCQNSIVNLTSYQSEMTSATGNFSYSAFGSPISNPTSFPVFFNVTVNVTFTDANTGCSNLTTITFTTVQPTFLSAQAPSICTGDNPFDLTSLEAAMTNESGTFEYFFNNVKIADPTQFTAANGNVVNVTFTNAAGCQSMTTITFNVRNTPPLVAQTPVICASDNPFNLTNLQSAITNNNFNGNFEYIFNNVPINNPGAFNASDGDVVQVRFINFDGCSNTTTITFTVNPLPILMPQTANICTDGTLYDLTSLEPLITDAAGTFQYATINGQIFSPDQYFGNTNTIVTVTFTDDETGCTNTTTITFQTGNKVIAAATDKMICSGESTALTVLNANNFGGATFRWTASYNGATGGAGSAFNVAFGANAINETLTNATSNDIDVVYTITPVFGNDSSCDGDPITVTITVKPKPQSTNGAKTICSDVASAVTLSSSNAVAIASYNITNINSNGLAASAGDPMTGTGFDASAIADDAWTNTTPNQVQVVYELVPVSNQGCLGDAFFYTLTINPEPAEQNQSVVICSGEASNVTIGSGINDGRTFSITNIENNGLSASAGNPSTGNSFNSNVIADDAWTNTTSSPVNVVYTIVPVSNSNCEGDPFTITLTINPELSAENISKTVCSDLPNGILLNDILAAPSYEIKSIESNGLLASAGNPATGTGFNASEIANDAWANTTDAPVNVVYSIAPEGTNNCGIVEFTITLTINPEPQGNNLQTETCSGIALNVDLQNRIVNNLNNITFSWSADDNPNVTGETITTSNASSITDPLTNTSGTDQVVTYTVTPTSENNCAGDPFTITVTVYPLPTASSGGTSSICIGQDAVFSLTGTAGAEVTYMINDGNTQTTTLDGNGAATVTINNPSADQTLKLISITNTVNNCTQNLNGSASMVVNALPIANAANAMLCESSAGSGTAIFDLTLLESTVSGGAANVLVSWFSDANLTTSIATPATFNSGSTTVYAKVTNTITNCSNSAAVTLTVNPLPNAGVNAGASPICAGQDAVFNLTGTAGAEVTYKINNGAETMTILDNTGSQIITISGATITQNLTLIAVKNTNCTQPLSLSATITVEDITQPVLDCNTLTDITQNNDVGVCEATININAPQATDNCDGIVTATGTRDDGKALNEPYPLGMTTITWTFADKANNSIQCSQKVIISDAENPTFDCNSLSDLIQNNDADKCEANVTVNAPQATDNCDGMIIATGTRDDGKNLSDPYPVGMTTITWTFADNTNNSIQCSQKVIVEDTQKPQVTKSTIAACYQTTADAEAAARAATTADDNCTATNELTVEVSTIGDCSAVITVKVTDKAGNFDEVTYNTRIDGTPPTLTAGTINAVYPTVAAAEAAALAATSASDNCPGDLIKTVETTGTCNAEIKVTVTDGCGNDDFVIYNTIIDNEAPQTPTLPDATDECSVTLTPPTTTDNCAGTITGTTTDPTVYNQQGTFEVTWTFSDGNGNSTMAIQKVIVDDVSEPSFTCPTAQDVNLNGDCKIIIPDLISNLIGTDNCGTVTFSQSPVAGTAVSILHNETTKVTITADDGNGNTANCEVTLTGKDVTDPTATCKAVTITLNANGAYTLQASEIDDNSADNCGIVKYTLSKTDFTCANIGKQMVTLTVEDAAGLKDECTVEVTVLASAACEVTITNAGGPNVFDPCTCSDEPGFFDEEIILIGNSAGEEWVLSENKQEGLLDPANNNQPFAIGTAFQYLGEINGQHTYSLVGRHASGVGFDIIVTSPFYPNDPQSIRNTCFYPKPIITTDLSGPFCQNVEPILLQGNAGAATGSGTFAIDANVTNALRPALLSVGEHTVTFTWDAGDPADETTKIGCVASVSQPITIIASPVVEAGNAITICQTKTVSLVGVGQIGNAPGGVWRTSGDGHFTGGTAFGSATAYVPGAKDKKTGKVTLTLTANAPQGVCQEVKDELDITILKVSCGQFPWNGKE